jgi:Protein of unknown function (DUF5818)
MNNFLGRVAVVLVFAAGMAAFDMQSSARQTPNAAQPTATQQQQPNDMQTQDAKAFNGTIVKEKGKLVLKDTAANVSYQLDNQEKAKAFEGKPVRVTGKLDLDTNLIHVESIEGAS